MSPRSICTTVMRTRLQTGTPSFLSTRAHSFAPGIASSPVHTVSTMEKVFNDGVLLTSKGPRAARSRGGDRDRAEDGYDQNEEDQGKTASWTSHYPCENIRQSLACWSLQDICQRRKREADGQYEQKPPEAADRDAQRNGARYLNGRIRTFFSHRRYPGMSSVFEVTTTLTMLTFQAR